MQRYKPEGMQDIPLPKTLAQWQAAMQQQTILQARVLCCDNEHNLLVDLGNIKGVIPKNEGAIGIAEGTTKDIAIIARVNKPVQFLITELQTDEYGATTAILSRKAVQLQCNKAYLSKLNIGDVICGKITHLEQFGCFVDIGCGIISLLPIDAISISRIAHPSDRFVVGQEILVVIKQIDAQGKIYLTHKELLGTWQENADQFSAGQTVPGIVRSIEPYGVFVELTPNLAGLAELHSGVRVGQHASVFIKSLLPERMKVKLVIVDHFDAEYQLVPPQYHTKKNHLDHFRYSPTGCEKIIQTIF